jgi:hypothetical protein
MPCFHFAAQWKCGIGWQDPPKLPIDLNLIVPLLVSQLVIISWGRQKMGTGVEGMKNSRELRKK